MENNKQQLIEEIKLFIQYSVPEDELKPAVALVDRYKNNGFILRLFREYYTSLPEEREEAVVRIARLVDRQGIHLLVVSTANFSYLYAVSVDKVVLLGEYLEEADPEVVAFFGCNNQQEFLQLCRPVKELDEYAANKGSEKLICPVCGVAEGDCHLLGCSVEICPWCEGQLSKCNCRFEQLKTEHIEDEQQLEEFIELLDAKGRVPYRKGQAPAYPGTSAGLDDVRTGKENS